MEPITLALIALGGLALVGGGKKSRGAGGGWAIKGKEDRVRMINEIRNMSFYYSNRFGSMPYLADFMTVTAFRESNFNPNKANPEIEKNPMNAARGLFGMRPETAFTPSNGLEALRNSPNTLLNPRWAFVTAVNGVYRACDSVYRDSGRTANFAAVRRWWGYPSNVHDFDLTKQHSKDSLAKLEKAIDDCNDAYGTQIDPDFIWRPISGWKNYPGMGIMLSEYGLT